MFAPDRRGSLKNDDLTGPERRRRGTDELQVCTRRCCGPARVRSAKLAPRDSDHLEEKQVKDSYYAEAIEENGRGASQGPTSSFGRLAVKAQALQAQFDDIARLEPLPAW